MVAYVRRLLPLTDTTSEIDTSSRGANAGPRRFPEPADRAIMGQWQPNKALRSALPWRPVIKPLAG